MRIIGSSPGRSVLQRGRGVRFVIENPGPAVLRYLRSLPCSNTSDEEGESGNGSWDGTATAGETRSGAGDNQ